MRLFCILLLLPGSMLVCAECRAVERSPVISVSDSLAVDADFQMDSLIRFAQSLLGTPYRYGARGPESFDCSGFTRYVYRNFDISLPGSSRTQVNSGVEVLLDSVKKGDLIFLTSPNSKGRPGHVGIVSRNDEEGIYFIHSSSVRGVVESKLDAYYRQRLLTFRRLIFY